MPDLKIRLRKPQVARLSAVSSATRGLLPPLDKNPMRVIISAGGVGEMAWILVKDDDLCIVARRSKKYKTPYIIDNRECDLVVWKGKTSVFLEWYNSYPWRPGTLVRCLTAVNTFLRARNVLNGYSEDSGSNIRKAKRLIGW